MNLLRDVVSIDGLSMNFLKMLDDLSKLRKIVNIEYLTSRRYERKTKYEAFLKNQQKSYSY
jgi:hypothetical protein